MKYSDKPRHLHVCDLWAWRVTLTLLSKSRKLMSLDVAYCIVLWNQVLCAPVRYWRYSQTYRYTAVQTDDSTAYRNAVVAHTASPVWNSLSITILLEICCCWNNSMLGFTWSRLDARQCSGGSRQARASGTHQVRTSLGTRRRDQ